MKGFASGRRAGDFGFAPHHLIHGETLSQNRPKIFAFAFLLTLVMAFNLAAFLNQPTTTLAWGATAGFLAGFGWVGLGFGVVGLFESRSLRYVLINGGYMMVAFVVMGAIIGGWR